MPTNLATGLTDTAERQSDRIAIKLDAFEISFEQLNEASARVAAPLKEKGLEPGDRVGIMLPNVPQFPAAYYGVLRSGGVAMFTAMLHEDSKDDVDVSSLRVCMSGGSAMPVEVMKGFEEQFGCKVLKGYGLSETSPVASFNHPDRERKRWFYSGDMGQVDEDGYFSIVDRKNELIIRGGYNVYPREVEEVLYEHPAVLEAAVIGVPDDKMGEEVGAAVVLKEGEDVSEDDLREYVKSEVASYKYPRKIWFEDELPKGPTGKILKKDIEMPDRVEAG